MGDPVKHFAIERWADFVRGLLDEPTRAEMTRHLETGCERCAGALSRLQATASVVRRNVEVPEEVVARAKALFAAPAPQPGLWRTILTQLTFDSIAAPALEGVRGPASGVRRMIFEEQGFRASLLIDAHTVPRRLAITGQITLQGAAPSSAVPVLFKAKNKVVAEFTTNEFGEFYAELPVSPGLRLLVPDEAGRRQFEIALGSLNIPHS